MTVNNDDMMRKVAALIAKAEGTDNENESATFFAAAQRLILKYAIDEEAIREARRATQRVEDPIVQDWEFAVHDAHAKGRMALLNVIARAHHVKFLVYRNTPKSNMWRGRDVKAYSQWGMFVGYESDIEHVKILYASLTTQWARFVHRDTIDQNVEKRNVYAFRTGHLVGFAARIRSRFIEIQREVYSGNVNANALMTNKDANIDAWYEKYLGLDRIKLNPICNERHPKDESRYCNLDKDHDGKHKFDGKIKKDRHRAVDTAGYYAGQDAANNADLMQTKVANKERIGSGE